MRSRVRKSAHLLERIGLAMAGAASGLFVAAHVGSSTAVFTSESFIVMMMIGGAVGFYQGIDTPPLAFHAPNGRPSKSDPQSQGRFYRIPQRRRHVSRYIDGFCIGHRYRASLRSAHLLDNDDHAGMGGWRVDANHCRGDCTHAPLRLVAFASRSLCLYPQTSRELNAVSALCPISARKEVERVRRAANRALTSARWNELPRGPFLPNLYPRPEPNFDLCRPTVRTNRPYPLIVHRHKGAPHNVRRSIHNIFSLPVAVIYLKDKGPQ